MARGRAEIEGELEEPRKKKKRGMFGCLVWLAILAIGFYVVMMLILPKVDVGQIGVRTPLLKLQLGSFELAGNRKVCPPGRYFVIPFGVHRWNTYDARVRNLDMVDEDQQNVRDSEKNITLKTRDGNDLWVDVSVIYQIDVEKADVLIDFYEDNETIVTRGIEPISRTLIRSIVGELTTEEFYNAEKRRAQESEVLKQLNERFNPEGIKIYEVLIRNFHFTVEVEQAIAQRNLADERALVNKSKARAAEELAVRDKIVAEGEANARVEIARGDTEAQKLAADADRYRQVQEAEGDRELRLAEAEGRRLKADAFAQSGSRAYVALEMARTLSGLEALVLPAGSGGINPYNLELMMRQLGLELPEEAGQ